MQLEITPHNNVPFGMIYLPNVPNEEFEIYNGISYMREGVVQALHVHKIYRPAHNI